MPKYISNVKTPKVSVAPMIDRTDRFFRYFCRILSKRALLYTEMVTAPAIIHGDRNKLLDFDMFEKPVSLQIAGSTAEEIYQAVKIAEEWDYDEVNLNVGCPSDRVSGNMMGACLMAYPELVMDMVQAMREATEKPVTVKHRIGIEGKNILPDTFERTLLDRYEDLYNFIDIVEKAKADRFTIHARIAVLEGLSPKENREIPPLRYEDVYRIKQDFPHLNIEINGGIKTVEQIEEQLRHVDGVMIGRIAYDNPFILKQVDKFFEDGQVNNISRREVIEKMIEFVQKLEAENFPAHYFLRHTNGLFFDKAGSRLWKQKITPPWDKDRASEVLAELLKTLPQEVLDEKY